MLGRTVLKWLGSLGDLVEHGTLRRAFGRALVNVDQLCDVGPVLVPG